MDALAGRYHDIDMEMRQSFSAIFAENIVKIRRVTLEMKNDTGMCGKFLRKLLNFYE